MQSWLVAVALLASPFAQTEGSVAHSGGQPAAVPGAAWRMFGGRDQASVAVRCYVLCLLSSEHRCKCDTCRKQGPLGRPCNVPRRTSSDALEAAYSSRKSLHWRWSTRPSLQPAIRRGPERAPRQDCCTDRSPAPCADLSRQAACTPVSTSMPSFADPWTWLGCKARLCICSTCLPSPCNRRGSKDRQNAFAAILSPLIANCTHAGRHPNPADGAARRGPDLLQERPIVRTSSRSVHLL